MADAPVSPGNAPERAAPADVAPLPAPAVWRPQFNPWLIGVVVALAAFMEVLKTSIANVALPYMAGSLGASNDQSTWVIILPRVERHRAADQRMVLEGAGPQALFYELSDDFHLKFPPVRGRSKPGRDHLLSDPAGPGGGGLQPMAQAILADISLRKNAVWPLRSTA